MHCVDPVLVTANPLPSHWVRYLIGNILRFVWTIDDWRVRRHLARVETQLREAKWSIGTAPLQSVRQQNLDRLHRYWTDGQFPRNHDQGRWLTPCFIDKEGRVCAVASLIIESGEAQLARHIAINANHAAIKAMNFPALEAWVARSGLSIDELADIQPAYMGSTLAVCILLGAVLAVVMWLLTVLQQFTTVPWLIPVTRLAAPAEMLIEIGLTLGIGWSLLSEVITRRKVTADTWGHLLAASTLASIPSAAVLLLTTTNQPNSDSGLALLLSKFNLIVGLIAWAGLPLLLIATLVREQMANQRRKRIPMLTGPENLPELLTFFSDRNDLARKSAIEAAVKMGSAAIPSLLAQLHSSGDFYVVKQTAEALEKIGDRSVVTDLMAELTSRLDEWPSPAKTSFGGTWVPNARSAVIKAVVQLNPAGLLDYTLNGLTRFLIPPGTPAPAAAELRPNMITPYIAEGQRLVSVLGAIGSPTAVEGLISALRAEKRGIRERAAEALLKLDPAAFPELIAALDNPDPYTRYRVAQILGQLKDASAVPALIAHLSDTAPIAAADLIWFSVGETAAYPASRSEICVRDAMKTSLRQIGTSEALAAIQEP